MNKNDFDIKTLIHYVEREYGLEREVIFDIIELSILKAASKNKNLTDDLYVKVDRNDYSIHVYDKFVVDDELTGRGIISSKVAKRYNGCKPVNEGDVLEIEIPLEQLGRVCARDSRMMILQKIKFAKNSNLIEEYKDRIGDIVSGFVSGFEKGNIIFTVNGNVDMVIPRNEKISSEKYKIGDPISGIILKINEKQKHSPIVVSRSSNKFVEKIIRNEVNEIDDGLLEIVEIARHPGYKTKIAIKSINPKIDPIGSCVGKNGIRIKNIMRELNGERIDVVRYSDNLNEFIKDAFSPIKIDSINNDIDDPSNLIITVSPAEYMNTVGKNGKNISLVSKLVGYKLHVEKSLDTSTFEEKKKNAIQMLSDIFDISIIDATTIVNSGYLTVDGIAEEDLESFVSMCGLDEVAAKGIHAAACTVNSMAH